MVHAINQLKYILQKFYVDGMYRTGKQLGCRFVCIVANQLKIQLNSSYPRNDTDPMDEMGPTSTELGCRVTVEILWNTKQR